MGGDSTYRALANSDFSFNKAAFLRERDNRVKPVSRRQWRPSARKTWRQGSIRLAVEDHLAAIRVLEKTILYYLDQRNGIPSPSSWTADPDAIFGKLARLSKCIAR
jgi:hypothetical protein